MLKDGDKGVILQRDKQTYAVAPHLPCGLVTPEILRRIADVAEKHQVAALKVTSAARIALVGLREDQVDQVWHDLGMEPGAAVGLCVRSVKACPGTTFCKRALADSLAVGLDLDRRYHGKALPGKLKFGVSGCGNQCAETSFKDIGLVGTARGWKLLVGGCGGGKPRIADLLAEGLTTEAALSAVDNLVEFFAAQAKPHERMGRLCERLGLDALRTAAGV